MIPPPPMLTAALALLAALGLAFWVLILVELLRYYRGVESVHAEPGDVSAVEEVTASIVVPAHDEAETLEGCLRAILAQTHPRFDVVVVDDRSTDSTPAIARRVAREDPRVRTLQVDELPSGWTGKTHALWRGAEATTADWLCFVDADTVLSPSAVAACLRHASRRGLDLLAGWPRLGSRAVVSRLVDPLCAALLASWHRRGDGAGRTRSTPFAAGPFILVRTEAYRAVGGHQAVREQLLEDIALAERFESAGRPSAMAFLTDLVAVKTYETLAESVAGWTRILSEAARGNVKRLLRRAVLLPPLALSGYAALAGGCVALHTGSTLVGAAAVGTGLLELALMTMTAGFLYDRTRAPRRYALLFPIAALLTAYLLAAAALRVRAGDAIEWHGRRYPRRDR